MTLPPAKLEFPALQDRRFPVHKIAHDLEPYLRLIVERFQPEKIVLFGSQIHGEPRPDSDVDILIVRSGIRSENESNREILNAFWDIPGRQMPLTVLTKTPERVQDRLAQGSPFYRDIFQQGLVVYV